jgi:MoaA/NifB/PqqE/SkfB family radical SAM enzyme
MNNLKHIEINIWKACNNRCRFCMSSKSELWDTQFTPIEVLKEKITDYYNKWYNSIWFLWWEVSIHPNVIEIITYCKKVGYTNIIIISNWLRFHDYDFAKEVMAAWLTRINFSIHSHIDEIEDYLTWIKWWLKKKLKAVDNFKEFYNQGLLKDNISVNIVLNSKNISTIVESVLYFYKVKKVDDIRINYIWLNDDSKENWDDLKISYTEFIPYLKKLIYVSLKYNIRITFDAIPICIFYKIDNINYKSLVKKFLWESLDYITDIDNINTSDKFNWKERKKNMLKMQFDQCEKCIYNIACEWVWKNYWTIYGNSEFIPIIWEK